MIEAKDVSLFYEDFQALQAISFTIPKGSINGLAGINGAGKSTLIKCLLGLFHEFEGTISIDGRHVKKEKQWIKEHCSYAPEETELFDFLTGHEFLQLIASLKKIPHAQQAIDQLVALFDMHSFLPVLINEYSHGMRQKMLLSAALLGNPDFIFIDEAINGLDTLSLFRLKEHLEHLKHQGKTILIASHVLPILADWSDQLLIIHQGKLLTILTRQAIKSDQRPVEKLFIDLINEQT